MQHPDGTLEFFDSYGVLDGKPIKLDSEVAYANYTRKHLDGKLPKLSRLVKGSGLPLQVNHYKFQKMSDNIATCGRWVCARHILRNYKLPQFAKMFIGHKYPPDYMVTVFTDKYRQLNSKSNI